MTVEGLRRWLAFNVVGSMGVVVQLLVLLTLTEVTGLDYLVATGLAVECAILHNFVWHERWTWRDRGYGMHGDCNLLGAELHCERPLRVPADAGPGGLRGLPAHGFLTSDRVLEGLARPSSPAVPVAAQPGLSIEQPASPRWPA